MTVARRIGENRSVVIFFVLVLVSIGSLATGARGRTLSAPVRSVVSIVVSPLWAVLHGIQSAADYTAGLVIHYNAAQRELVGARQQLSVLAQRVADRDELRAENSRLTRMLNFARSHPELTLQAASVVDRIEGKLLVDRGSLHGVQPFMCALNEQGVVGIVTEVQPFTSFVSTLHRRECRIGAMIKRNRVRGNVRGSGPDFFGHVCAMQNLDLNDDVLIGDTVVTDGGGLFPAGHVVGTVKRVDVDSGSLLKTAIVSPAADPYRVDEVFIVHKIQTPVDALAGPAYFGGVESASMEAPDMRSLQERYAP